MAATLEDRLVVGDESVVRELFEAHGPMILAIGRRLLGDEAEDFVRQVLVTAWRHRERFDPSKGSLAAWLGVIARLGATDRLAASAGSGTEAMVDQVVDRVVLARSFDGLAPVRREVLELGFVDDLTNEEIAERLDLPQGTVRGHLRQGLEALQRELEDSRARA